MQSSYVEMREIRKQYFQLALKRLTYTKKDSEECNKIKSMLQELKNSHPELCSKDVFMKAEESRNIRNATETTFDRPSTKAKHNDNMSKNLFASFPSLVVPQQTEKPENAAKQAKPKKSNPKNPKKNPKKFVKKFVTRASVQREKDEKKKKEEKAHEQQQPPVECDTIADPQDIQKQLKQYVLWAIELEEVLNQQQKK